MGSEKHTLEINGETFLDRAVNSLKPVCESIKVVLSQTQTIETNLEIVRDIYAQRGALGAIHAALKNCETKLAIVLAVDLPFVTPAALENLSKIALSSNKFVAFVPRQTDGRAQPLCAVYRVKYCLSPLEKLIQENDSASVRDFLEVVSPKYIQAAQLSENENLLFNVNTPADFSQMQKSAGEVLKQNRNL